MFCFHGLTMRYFFVFGVRKSFVACRSRGSSRMVEGFPLAECNPVMNMEESSQEDCLPFILDDDSSGTEESPSFLRRRSSIKSTYGFSLDSKVDRQEASPTTSNNVDHNFKYGTGTGKENSTLRLDSHKPSDIRLTDPLKPMEQKPVNARSRGVKEFI